MTKTYNQSTQIWNNLKNIFKDKILWWKKTAFGLSFFWLKTNGKSLKGKDWILIIVPKERQFPGRR